MKKKAISLKKLVLKKETISSLSSLQENQIIGGIAAAIAIPATWGGGGSCNLVCHGQGTVDGTVVYKPTVVNCN